MNDVLKFEEVQTIIIRAHPETSLHTTVHKHNFVRPVIHHTPSLFNMKTLKSNTSFLGKEVLHCKKSSVTIRKWHIKTSICTLFLGGGVSQGGDSINGYLQLPLNEKQNHTLSNCKASQDQSPTLVNTVPGPRKTTKVPASKFTKADLSTPTKFGRKVLRQLNTVAHTTSKKSIQDVLI